MAEYRLSKVKTKEEIGKELSEVFAFLHPDADCDIWTYYKKLEFTPNENEAELELYELRSTNTNEDSNEFGIEKTIGYIATKYYGGVKADSPLTRYVILSDLCDYGIGGNPNRHLTSAEAVTEELKAFLRIYKLNDVIKLYCNDGFDGLKGRTFREYFKPSLGLKDTLSETRISETEPIYLVTLTRNPNRYNS